MDQRVAVPGPMLSIRTEGEQLVAYWTMGPVYGGDPAGADAPLQLATFLKATIAKTPGAFEAWQQLLRSCVEEAHRASGLPAPVWTTLRAPASDRLGNG